MKDLTGTLQGEIDRFTDLLQGAPFFTLGTEEKESIRTRAGELRQRLAELEENFLMVGLLGGTGVGKSTLMNALAGSQIASASHRRPHTDQVLIYRHERSGPLPALPLAGIPWQERLHRADPMAQVLLCDLPDFDSLMGQHREHVLRFLEHLDLLVWITSPEKYADARFYEFLEGTAKAESNFIFLLNKTDLLFEGSDREEGYRRMEQVAGGFRTLLSDAGIPEPLLFVVSAGSIAHSAPLEPWNQFPPFRQHLFQRRAAKVVKAIKTANLEVELGQLFSCLKREEGTLRTLEGILDRGVKNLDMGRDRWRQSVQDAVALWLKGVRREEIQPEREDSPALIGPGYLLARLLGGRRRPSAQGIDISSTLSRFSAPEELRQSFKRPLQQIEDRLTHGALVENLPSALKKRLSEILDVEGRFEDLGEQFYRVFAGQASAPDLPSYRGSRLFQRLVYLLVLLLFLLAVGGPDAWRRLADDPGWTNTIRLLLSGVIHLFSAEGLAALGSYTLINLLIGARFYRRYRERLHRSSLRIEERIRQDLLEAWDRTREGLLADLKGYREEVLSRLRDLSSLVGSQ
ncbi:MAG: 50S ribosome-binding GTPase [Deltaproteobacteria bacterium]|nr:50S ribosome-binding GTPase [Deltaproteobacteria bacterium]